MSTEPSYLLKLWNRGVDVGVGVETSVVIGLIGLLLYRRKLWLDAERQRQEIRIAAEADAVERRRVAAEHLDRLGRERDMFAVQATQMASGIQLAVLVERFYQWLESSNIHHLPRNLKTLTENPHWANGLRGATIPNIRLMGAEVEKLIRETEFASSRVATEGIREVFQSRKCLVENSAFRLSFRPMFRYSTCSRSNPVLIQPVKARDLGEGRLRFGGLRGDRGGAMFDYNHNLNPGNERSRSSPRRNCLLLAKARAAARERMPESAQEAVPRRRGAFETCSVIAGLMIEGIHGHKERND